MALKRFATSGSQGATTTAANVGIVKLDGTAATRGAIYEWDFSTGAAAAPVDQNYRIQLIRHTTAGSWATATPAALDAADPAAVCVGGQTCTTASTASTVLMNIGINARAGFRWVAIPDSELILPATANNGIEMDYAAVSGGTDVNYGVLFHQE